MNTINFKLKGLTCEACVKLATNRIKKVPGVQEVKIDLSTENAKVIGTSDIDLDVIKQSLVDTNYIVID